MERDAMTTGSPRVRGRGAARRQRLWRWCVVRTLRDGRLIRRRGQWVGGRNLERMFARRWHDIASNELAQEQQAASNMTRDATQAMMTEQTHAGRAVIRAAFRRTFPHFRSRS